MLRRLHPVQPDSFSFTPENRAWVDAQLTKYPENRAQSAIIPVLWRAQEQEGWLTRPALEYCADLLGMAYMRALEVATFYFMFQLAPVGTVAHIQVCGTTTCMICGAEELIAVCRAKIAPRPHMLSEDGRFSWEEVECLGACTNAPMAHIGKDYYEDLTAETLAELIDRFAAGEVPQPGPQNGRFSSEALGGATALQHIERVNERNASVARALDLGDTIKRIDGGEVPILTPWVRDQNDVQPDAVDAAAETKPVPSENAAVDSTGVTKEEAQAASKAKPPSDRTPEGIDADTEETDGTTVPRADVDKEDK